MNRPDGISGAAGCMLGLALGTRSAADRGKNRKGDCDTLGRVSGFLTPISPGAMTRNTLLQCRCCSGAGGRFTPR